MTRRKQRKSSKDGSDVDIGQAIAMAVRSGKTALGSSTALHESRVGKAKVIIVAANAPTDIITELKFNLQTRTNIKLILSDQTSLQLGAAIGRPHHVSCLTIYEEGDSKILDLSPASSSSS